MEDKWFSESREGAEWSRKNLVALKIRPTEAGATMRTTSAKEMDSVSRLDGPARYGHFVKRVVDCEAAWGLWKDGWALMRDNTGAEVFPLWPAREYTEALCVGEWAGYVPEEISLDDLLNDLLPKLIKKGVLPGVFPTPQGKGVTPSARELVAALRREMEQYGD